MKQKLKKLMKNKKAVALIALVLVLLICLILIKSVFFPGHGSKYGNRLDEIEKYPITDEVINNIKNEISSLEKVKSINYNLEGRLINFVIKVEDDLIVSEAKNYSEKILENFSDDIKSYYDIQILIDSNIDESENYPIIGYKHKTSDSLVWKQ